MEEKIFSAYRVKFNDFGEVYILAQSFSDAENIFIRTGFGGEFPHIKEIVLVGRGMAEFLIAP